MTEFQELIKNFDRIRDYMRQFFVYGFKSRSSYEEKSSRTYDNERRRIESWLPGYIQSGYVQKEKHVYISVDSKSVPQNPLYAAWKSKSFTDNDILLHFFLLDLLWSQPEGMSANDLCNEIAVGYGVIFDTQTIRLKLKEYERAEILEAKKRGKSLYYRLLPLSLSQETWQALLCAVTFFQEAAPFGFVGSTILDHELKENQWFQFKHHFIVHTLEDGVLADILTAIQAHRRILFENKSSRSKTISTIKGVPLKIFVSTQTGRRYLCLYLEERRRFTNFRLDSITNVLFLDDCCDYEKKQQLLARNLSRCWGVSFGGPNGRIEEIYLKLFIDEETEPYVLERLYREGRGGEILKIRSHEYLYSGTFFDTNEMLAWVKTFTGRILDIQGSNHTIIAKVIRDLERLAEIYGGPGPVPLDSRLPKKEPTPCPQSHNHSIHLDSFPLPGSAPLPPLTERPELFDKLYNCYYQAVRQILAEASPLPVTTSRMTELSMKYGYLESSLAIVPRLTNGTWPLLKKTDGPSSKACYQSVLRHPDLLLPGMLPLTSLQKAWLKALLADQKLRLFLSERQLAEIQDWLADTKPLYRQEDFYYFDRYLDGDDYSTPSYQEHVSTILQALKEKKALILVYQNRHGAVSTFEAAPYQLQYSSKEDKFRLCCLKFLGRTFHRNTLLNVNRIIACHLSRRAVPDDLHSHAFCPIRRAREPVLLQISGERNSLERCMLHFANYEKHTRYDEKTNTWFCSIYYDLADETELLIEILSFGPVLRVLSPETFCNQLRRRTQKQHELFYGTV